jgi:hypothetical protein
MKPETVNRVMQTINDQFQQVGFNGWDEGITFAKDVLTKFVSLLSNRAQLEKLLSDEPEPSPDEFERMLQDIKKFSGVFRTFILDFAKKEIPPDRGGRPSVLGTPEEQGRRIQLVLSLIGKGASTTHALKRVAQREDISLSSMQRIWRTRSGLSYGIIED